VKVAPALLMILPLLSCSCAYLLKGTTDSMTVITDPADADVAVNGREEGKSPVSFTVPSNEDLHIHLSKDGCQPQDINSPARFRWGYEVWSFCEFVVPMFIDMAYGAAWGHDPTTVTGHLQPLPAGQSKQVRRRQHTNRADRAGA
jgi:hypothetical protein